MPANSGLRNGVVKVSKPTTKPTNAHHPQGGDAKTVNPTTKVGGESRLVNGSHPIKK